MEEDDGELGDPTTWVSNPFGRTFDLISSEYGWTDKQILDLDLQRMLHIRKMILDRLDEERVKRLRVKEVEIRMLASTIQAAAGNKSGADKAQKFAILPPIKVPVSSWQIAQTFGQPENDSDIDFTDLRTRLFGEA